MQDTITVDISRTNTSYDIGFFEDHKGLLQKLQILISGKKVLVVTDENVHQHHANVFESLNLPTVILPPGEQHKSWTSIEKITNQAFTHELDRESLFIGIGGGVITDLTGFAASLFMRGIPVIQVPTTLLAMVDASIGGKTGIDNAFGKNVIGTFHQPSAVLLSHAFLQTLPEIETKNGLCEMIKHGLLASPEHLQHLKDWNTQNPPTAYSLLPTSFSPLIHESILVKKHIIEADEKESGIRGHLNLGHTYGHAIEHLSEYSIPHGQAVAMGCVLAAKKAEALGWIDASTRQEIEQIFTDFSIDTTCPYDESNLLSAMTHDKKKKDGHIRLILPKGIGEVEYYAVKEI